MSMFPVWLTATDGSVTKLLAQPGAGFSVRMYPEMISHWEARYSLKLASIATDTPDNIIWRAA